VETLFLVLWGHSLYVANVPARVRVRVRVCTA